MYFNSLDDLASIGELDGVATPSNGGNNGFGAGGFRQTAIGLLLDIYSNLELFIVFF